MMVALHKRANLQDVREICLRIRALSHNSKIEWSRGSSLRALTDRVVFLDLSAYPLSTHLKVYVLLLAPMSATGLSKKKPLS